MTKETATKARELINQIQLLEKDIRGLEEKLLDIEPEVRNCGYGITLHSLVGADLLPLLHSKLKSAETKLAKLK